jgi:hypothetical protein
MADFDLKITKMVEITKFRLVPGWHFLSTSTFTIVIVMTLVN